MDMNKFTIVRYDLYNELRLSEAILQGMDCIMRMNSRNQLYALIDNYSLFK